MVTFIKIENREIRVKFFLPLLYWDNQSFLSLKGLGLHLLILALMVLHSQDLWALLTVWRSSLPWEHNPLWPDRGIILWTGLLQEWTALRKNFLSSLGFNTKEIKKSSESLHVAENFTEKILFYFPNMSNTLIPRKMLMLVSFSLLENPFLPSPSGELFIS